VTFIDPARLGWFVGINPDPYMTSDGVHPNEIGHKLISQYLTTDLMRLGFAGPS
jgi:lysophospholipase L1-like esterase